jgi:hypothetical protein
MEENGKNMGEELDLVALLRSLWARRRFVLRVTGAVVAVGLVVALFGEVRYTSSAVMVPQMGQKAPGGNLQGLAAMAGINLNQGEQSDVLSPLIYPAVVGSVPFQKELMHTEVSVGGRQVTLVDYFTKEGYRKFSLFPFLKKYTLGLPGLAVKAVRGERPAPVFDSLPAGVGSLTADENECMKTLADLVTVAVDDKNGYVTLSAAMPEALISAQVAVRAQQLLQEYVTRFKVEKVQANLDFIGERYAEVKSDFETKQRALAAFQDSNRDISSAVARTREARLSNERDLAFSIYSELARQREQAGIKVKEDTPTFTVVEPVTVPIEKSAPRRGFILGVSLFLGLFAGCGLALALPWLAETFGWERFGNWCK